MASHTSHEHQARIEDTRFMADTGESLTGAAQRLHLSRNSLDKWLRHHDPATLTRLMANEHYDEHQQARHEGRWAS